MLPDFFFCSLFPAQQTTSGIGHRVKSSFFGLATNTLNMRNNKQQQQLSKVVFPDWCVCFLPIHSGHQVRWMYLPRSHRRKVIQNFSSTFFLRCVPQFFSREVFSHSFPSSTVKKSNFVY